MTSVRVSVNENLSLRKEERWKGELRVSGRGIQPDFKKLGKKAI